MNICFLDIDGVLNSQLYFKSDKFQETVGNNQSSLDYMINQIDPVAIEILNDFVEETESKIVLSSTWRNVAFDKRVLYHRGFKGYIIDVIPTLARNEIVRGNRIYKWICDNSDVIGEPSYHFNSYVIFDDDSDMLLWQKDNFFQVDNYCGITPTVTYKAKHFLKRMNND